MRRDPEAGRRFTHGPTRGIPSDPDTGPREGIGLCLSGGGYRAMLFHAGGLWRLNELGVLPRVGRISAVSGGSLAAGVLAVRWPKLEFGADGVAANFEKEYIHRLRRFADRTMDVQAILLGLLLPGSINSRLAGLYRRHLVGRTKLAELPVHPDFVFNATDMQSGGLWLFSRRNMGDFRVGRVEQPEVDLATAVAASSAFPPFLSPALLRVAADSYVEGSGIDLQHSPFTTRPHLSDGGVYDNLGLESVFKRYKTVLVSDAGGHIRDMERPPRTWGLAMLRVMGVLDNQVRELRKQQLLESYRAGAREGAYWAIRSNLDNFEDVPGKLPAPKEATTRLAGIRTRLASLDTRDQQHLVNWGYATADAGMRGHVLLDAPPPERFPYPDAGVG